MDFPFYHINNQATNQLGEDNVGGVPLSSLNAMMPQGTTGLSMPTNNNHGGLAGMLPSGMLSANGGGNGLAGLTAGNSMGGGNPYGLTSAPSLMAGQPFMLGGNGGGNVAAPGAEQLLGGPHAHHLMGEDSAALEKAMAVGASSQGDGGMAKGIPYILSRYWNLQPSAGLGAGTAGNGLLTSADENFANNGDRPYRDLALVPEDEISKHTTRATGKEKTGGSNFPAKLHEILSRTDISSIISWAPHGRSWRVYKPKAFEEKIIPQYFRHCKYNSFTRQVNGWGFRRITQGPDHNSYFHEMFLRGLPHLCKRMRRLSASGGARTDSAHTFEPDFYSISKISPLPMIGSGTEMINGQSNNDKNEADDSLKANGNPEDRGNTNSDDTSKDGDKNKSSEVKDGETSSPGDTMDKENLRIAEAASGFGMPSADLMRQLQTFKAEQAHQQSSQAMGGHNEFASWDAATRQQLIQAQYLNAVNAAGSNNHASALLNRERAMMAGANSMMAGANSMMGANSFMNANSMMGANSFMNPNSMIGNNNTGFGQDNLQQQILAQQALLNSLQGGAQSMSPNVALPQGGVGSNQQAMHPSNFPFIQY